MTKSLLHKLGYKKGINCYFKTRQVKVRQKNKATVQVRLNGSIFDVTGIEGSSIEFSNNLKTIKQLKDWEKFVFCS